MLGKKENKNSLFHGLYPAVLQLRAEESRRFTCALFRPPGSAALMQQALHELVEGALLAHLSRPLGQEKKGPEHFDSFDLVFFTTPEEETELAALLREEGWHFVAPESLTKEEHERLSVFQNEARKEKVKIEAEAQALWRLPLVRQEKELAQRLETVARETAQQVGEEVWGDRPGYFSKVYCDSLRRQVQLTITPDESGLGHLEDVVVGQALDGIDALEPAAFQALCDFVGVVLQARPEPIEVQWSTCPADEKTGLAPAPLLRARRPTGTYVVLPVGRDVLQQTVVPWSSTANKRPLVALIHDYLQRLKP